MFLPSAWGYLASVLKRKRVELKIFDLNVEPSRLDDFLAFESPKVIGISCSIGNARQTFEISGKLKTRFPECFIIVGGPYGFLVGANRVGPSPTVNVIEATTETYNSSN